MKRIHPILSPATRLTAIACLVIVVGCRSHPGGVANPFLAPDRVPPPATRALLPGQAQPYYPGDPLPVMQSAVNPQAPSFENPGLAWNQPTDPASPDDHSRALAFSSEPTVAIPSDSDSLRYPLPQPRGLEPSPPVAESAPAIDPAIRMAAVPLTQSVLPASYHEPMISQPTSDGVASFPTVPAVSGPWRSPQAVPPVSVPTAMPMAPLFAAPTAAPSNSMDVRLRAVPSPALAPTTPRIRLPAYPAAPTGAVIRQPGPIYAPPMQPVSVEFMQTVEIGPLPSTATDPRANIAAAPQFAGDGFRPRRSMR